MKSPGFFKPRETHNGRTITGEKVNDKKVIGEKSKWLERKLFFFLNGKKINGEKVVVEESKCDKVPTRK